MENLIPDLTVNGVLNVCQHNALEMPSPRSRESARARQHCAREKNERRLVLRLSGKRVQLEAAWMKYCFSALLLVLASTFADRPELASHLAVEDW